MPTCILVVLKIDIKQPLDAPAYIERETEVMRFPNHQPIKWALESAQSKYPQALAYEIYEPISDASAVPRH